ncbi:NAD(P)/FAD-dependent oxidoreductase [Marinomonas sp. 2405UD68-3]|uniref:NAD(P)/FAD-dependent oxidoreductase n=1 Tax=Marinomonas sp. 2405UD68-3 TaxID=3391835 RepID=UPI0039C9A7ED
MRFVCVSVNQLTKLISTMNAFDVIVIGGGPAGLVSALLMARTGKKVAILDKPAEVNEKVGESMPATTNRLLKKLDLPLLSQRKHDFIAGSESYWAGQYEQQDFIHHLQGCDWRLDRLQFESDLHHLAKESGAQFFFDRLSNLYKNPHGWELETDEKHTLHADFIIDASGRSSVLSRHLSLEKEKGEPLVALWASVEIDDNSYQSMTTNTLLESQENGWWYAARLPNKKLLVIYHTSASNAGTITKRPSHWLDELTQTNVLSKHLPLERFINSKLNANNARSNRLTTPYGENWAACGDAAVSFDPLSSQGLYNAIATAAMLHKALQGDNRESALEKYGQSLERVAYIYQQKRQQYYQQAYDHYQTDFWKAHL